MKKFCLSVNCEMATCEELRKEVGATTTDPTIAMWLNATDATDALAKFRAVGLEGAPIGEDIAESVFGPT